MSDRRLIEDYLPLDDLNAISAKEKKHPKHPVALVHYWPARRPTTVSRAAIYAALVSGPRSGDERAEAAAFVRRLAAFKPDPAIVAEAGDRIRKAHGGRTPKVLDLFAGGGAIPLEAARLGCESHALDYNPVAHLIELCTLVYPQTFGPKLADDFEHWSGVVFERMRAEVGDMYPAVQVPATEDVTKQAELFGSVGEPPSPSGLVDPVACIRVRTVPCRRPGCTAPVPLVRQAWLRKKGGVVAAVPEIGRRRPVGVAHRFRRHCPRRFRAGGAGGADRRGAGGLRRVPHARARRSRQGHGGCRAYEGIPCRRGRGRPTVEVVSESVRVHYVAIGRRHDRRTSACSRTSD